MKRVRKPKEVDPVNQMLLLEALSASNYLAINKSLIKWCYSVFGSGIEMASFISCMLEKFRMLFEKDKLEEDGSFYFRMNDIESLLGISKYRIRAMKKQLYDLGYLYFEKRGVPAKDYYTINMEKLIKEWTKTQTSSSKETKPLGVKELDHLPYIKEKRKKESSKNPPFYEKDKLRYFLKFLPEEWSDDLKIIEAITNFIAHLNESGRKFTKVQIKALAENLSSYPKSTVLAAIKDTLRNGWFSIYPENIKGKRKTLPKEAEATPQERIAQYYTTLYGTGKKADKATKRFITNSFTPASHFLPKHANGQIYSLTENMLDMLDAIVAAQKDNINPKKLSFTLPSADDIMKDYVKWLEENDWIKRKDEKVFQINSKLFDKFLVEATEYWNGVNPVFG